MSFWTRANVKHMTVEAVIIRADGTRENLGIVSEYHRNPLRSLIAKLRK